MHARSEVDFARVIDEKNLIDIHLYSCLLPQLRARDKNRLRCSTGKRGIPVEHCDRSGMLDRSMGCRIIDRIVEGAAGDGLCPVTAKCHDRFSLCNIDGCQNAGVISPRDSNIPGLSRTRANRLEITTKIDNGVIDAVLLQRFRKHLEAVSLAEQAKIEHDVGVVCLQSEVINTDI